MEADTTKFPAVKAARLPFAAVIGQVAVYDTTPALLVFWATAAEGPPTVLQVRVVAPTEKVTPTVERDVPVGRGDAMVPVFGLFAHDTVAMRFQLSVFTRMVVPISEATDRPD